MRPASPLPPALFASALLAAALTGCGQAAPSSETETTPPQAAPVETATGASGPSAPPEGLEAALRRFNEDGDVLTYAFASIDLNGDGADEALAYVMGPMVCGSGGCNLYVLARDGTDWRVVTRTSVTQTPIGVLSTSTNGWRDLAVSTGGGGAPVGWARLRFDGSAYPTNPTVAPAAPLDGHPDVATLIASEPEAVHCPEAGRDDAIAYLSSARSSARKPSMANSVALVNTAGSIRSKSSVGR